MAKRTSYQIVGRYMKGAKVTGYELQSIEGGKSKKYTREQVAWLVGRGQVTNCEGQIYGDRLLLMGIGVKLESLPVQQENGEIQRVGNVPNIRKSDTGTDIMTKLFIEQSITDGRNIVGYMVRNAGGGVSKLSRAQVLELAKEGKLGNAKYQTSNGTQILRGVGINLNELPSIRLKGESVETPVPARVAVTEAIVASVAPKEQAKPDRPKSRGIGAL